MSGRCKGNSTSRTSTDVISPKVQQNAKGGGLTRQASPIESQSRKVTSNKTGDGKLAVFEMLGRTVGSTLVHEVSHWYILPWYYSLIRKQQPTQPTQPSNRNGSQISLPDSSSSRRDNLQSNTKNPTISTYTDRFGHIHVINVVCTTEVLSETYSKSNSYP